VAACVGALLCLPQVKKLEREQREQQALKARVKEEREDLEREKVRVAAERAKVKEETQAALAHVEQQREEAAQEGERKEAELAARARKLEEDARQAREEMEAVVGEERAKVLQEAQLVSRDRQEVQREWQEVQALLAASAGEAGEAQGGARGEGRAERPLLAPPPQRGALLSASAADISAQFQEAQDSLRKEREEIRAGARQG